MAHKWTVWIRLLGFLCFGGLECSIQSEGTDNENTVCANGPHSITCGDNTVIAITGFAYGYKGASLGCTTANESCCTYDRTTDCLEMAPNEATLMDILSGRPDGIVIIADNNANATCTSGYEPISTFNRISYQCIPDSRITEMCEPSSYHSRAGLPVYIQNRDYRSGTSILAEDTSCSVSIEILSRSTNIQLYTLHMQLSNSSSCQQSITVSNENNVVKTYNCDPVQFNQIQSEILTGNYFLFNLTNSKTTSGGKFWIGVEGASGNPAIVLFSPAVPRINCGDLSNPVNGAVFTTDTYYGSVANYTCTSGYDVTSGNIFRICQENATWSGAAALCSYNCGILNDTQNGFVSFNGIYPGHTATYGCDADYVMDGGNMHRSCIDASGWNGTALKCIYECGPLNSPHNGSVFYNTTTAGSQAWYICDSGFKLNGTQSRNCVSGTGWNGPEPTCSATSTTQHPNTDDKTLLITAIVLGSLVLVIAFVTIICFFIIKRVKTHPEKQEIVISKYQQNTAQSHLPQQDQSEHRLEDDTPKKKQKKKHRKRHIVQDAMGNPQDQSNQALSQPTKQDESEHDAPKKKKRKKHRKRHTEHDAMENSQYQNKPLEKEEEQPQYSRLFPRESPLVEERLERPNSSPQRHTITNRTTSKATQTNTYLLDIPKEPERNYLHDISLPTMEVPGIEHRPEESNVRQQKLKAFNIHQNTNNEIETHHKHRPKKHIHADHKPHGPTRTINATSEFLDHHCHDFVYHPHDALSHWSREEETKLGLPHEKKKKKKKKKTKYQEIRLYDHAQSGYDTGVTMAWF